MKTIFYIAGIMIVWLTLCFCLFSLTGCAKKTPVEESFTEVQTSIVQLKEQLPPECRADTILQKIEEIEWKRQTAEQVCQAKIKDTEVKYERLWWVIIFVILALTAKFFIKK